MFKFDNISVNWLLVYVNCIGLLCIFSFMLIYYKNIKVLKLSNFICFLFFVLILLMYLVYYWYFLFYFLSYWGYF